MDIVLQINWGWEIAMDLFLGGLGASCFFIAAVLFLAARDKFKRTIRFGAWVGVLSLIGAVSVLMLEVGVPQRAVLLCKSFANFNSWMPVGAWLLFSGIIVYGLYALSCTGWVTNKLKFLLKCRTALAIIGLILSIGITVYTGLLLSAIWADPLWNTMWLPALVMASAFCVGTVVMTGYAVLSGTGEAVASLHKALKIISISLIALTGIVLTCYLNVASSASEIGRESVEILTSGVVSSLFWYIAIVCGLGIPLLINILTLVRKELATAAWGILPMISIVTCLVGGFTLRLVILMAGLPIYT